MSDLITRQKVIEDFKIISKVANLLATCIAESCDIKTNADQIRAMSDEELAIEMTAKGGCPHDCETPDDIDTDCLQCWLDWLKKEVDT